MAAQKIRIESGHESWEATVLHTADNYAAVTYDGTQAIAKRTLGAWRLLPIHEVANMLAHAYGASTDQPSTE